MRNRSRTAVFAAGMLAAFSGGFTAGQHSGPGDNSLVEQTQLIVIDLAKAVDQLGSRELTLTRVTVAPNGHIGLHNHKDDPTVAYLIGGALRADVCGALADVRFGPKADIAVVNRARSLIASGTP
jgi:uncharacterized RmlC-like cupin family protein